MRASESLKTTCFPDDWTKRQWTPLSGGECRKSPLIGLVSSPNEIVAGIIEEGENAEETAKRECLEETGCEVKKITPIQGYFPAPGSSESYYELFLGEIISFDGVRIKGLESENENILVKSFKINEVKEMLKNNQITNGLTLIALQWFFLEYYKD